MMFFPRHRRPAARVAGILAVRPVVRARVAPRHSRLPRQAWRLSRELARELPWHSWNPGSGLARQTASPARPACRESWRLLSCSTGCPARLEKSRRRPGARLRPIRLAARLDRLPVRADSATRAPFTRPPPAGRVRRRLALVSQFSQPRQRTDVLPQRRIFRLSAVLRLVEQRIGQHAALHLNDAPSSFPVIGSL